MIPSRRDFLKLAGVAVPAAALGACAQLPPTPQFPPFSYSALGRFTFEAERLEVVQEYQAPLAPPNIEHLFAQRPDETLKRWANDRLAVTGRGDRLVRFVIVDARVTETQLPRETGVRATFTNEQAQRYDGRIEAAVELRQLRGNFRDGFASAAATRTRSVAENISLNDRERVWYEMVGQMMSDINAELDRQIRANMPRFLQM
ncbi:MAG: twin-arginine translocation signal domain-containing protein [Proteobacteria bacterium]|nr:twin-arginine translocation signal domain-containing protein [Pseudomonadota bacterium]